MNNIESVVYLMELIGTGDMHKNVLAVRNDFVFFLYFPHLVLIDLEPRERDKIVEQFFFFHYFDWRVWDVAQGE